MATGGLQSLAVWALSGPVSPRYGVPVSVGELRWLFPMLLHHPRRVSSFQFRKEIALNGLLFPSNAQDASSSGTDSTIVLYYNVRSATGWNICGRSK